MSPNLLMMTRTKFSRAVLLLLPRPAAASLNFGSKKLHAVGLVLLVTAAALDAAGATIGPWNQAELRTVPALTPTEEFAQDGFRSFYYDSVPYRGKPSRVYAYYKAPAGKPPEGGWPAVVCVHGGGGTAYTEWIDEWVKRGFAAIAMDLEGRLPDIAVKTPDRPRINDAGPDKARRWGDYAEPAQEQWFYHAVAQVVRAHSLVRSFPEVNPEKTGIIGVSWGAIIAPVAAAVDGRFRFAIASYGCGFLHESEGLNFAEVPESHQAATVALWDPSNYLPAVNIPFLWLNGTNDNFFPLDVWEKSVACAGGPTVRRIGIRMAHGHKSTWVVDEVYLFAEAAIRGETGFPNVGVTRRSGEKVVAEIEPAGSAVSATLVYTKDGGTHKNRLWEELPASLTQNQIEAPLPEGASAVFFNVHLPSGKLTSSSYLELK